MTTDAERWERAYLASLTGQRGNPHGYRHPTEETARDDANLALAEYRKRWPEAREASSPGGLVPELERRLAEQRARAEAAEGLQGVERAEHTKSIGLLKEALVTLAKWRSAYGLPVEDAAPLRI